ncbi:phospholipase D-like domain-containing protein [Komagataeibacter intermedius]|uniref:Phospholipase D n=2 Tax=Komagataeibacter intermedius TaxID=66229 RepID=A0A0N1N5U6_9PROT|nr:phospholipase D-like domain-containing protein [Komagataeibacter intermedius]KPH85727.1 phospholipase [Komagataeibacter intermedius AF2]MCF3637447.1 phospholipase D-like domain-containing protein [Komagataeibacter intermedius]GAN87247.1 phospholipase D [Komagataeibacter intermedius TF2]GBQ74695.1 phospholipase D [Komagataeibacter intermedius NRIC 0521]
MILFSDSILSRKTSRHGRLRWLAGCAMAIGSLVANGSTARADDSAQRNFQIVESVPENSLYGQSGIARTKDVWLDMIHHAQHSIDAAVFYITDKPGHSMSDILDALTERARAGVQVRIVVEQSFLKETGSVLEKLKSVPNITTAILPGHTLTGGILHAKYMVVDNNSVFVGSQNWDWRALEHIHEIGARIDNAPIARDFESDFNMLWMLAQGAPLSNAYAKFAATPDFAPVTQANPIILSDGTQPLIAFPAFSPAVMMPSSLTTEEKALVDMIHGARRTLRLQVLTMSAFNHYGARGYWPVLDTALRDAAARGVETQIIVSNWSLSEPMQSYLKSLSVLPHVTVKFSTVPDMPGEKIPFARVEHCKYAVADDNAVYIGTGNWEPSYFTTTVNASIFVHGASPARDLNAIFMHDWTGPYVTQLEAGRTYTMPKRD